MTARIKTLRLCLTILALASFQFSYAQQTWYVNSNIGDDVYDGQSKTDDGGGIGPFATIQHAVLIANDLDTIRVSEGDYLGYLQIDKSLVVLGANEGIAGNGGRNAESILYPTKTGISSPADGTNSLVQISSTDVVFEGFTLQGNNDTVNSSNDVNGEDVDYSYGVLIIGEFDNIKVRNNRILNFNSTGIEALGNVNSPNLGCQFGNNSIQNFANGSFGISCGNGFYSDLVANEILDVSTGVIVNDFTMSNGKPFLIIQNDINARTAGVLLSALNGNTSNIYIDNNRITSTNGDEGIALKNCVGNYNLQIRDCHITNYSNGIIMFGNDIAAKILERDTIESCVTGMLSITSFQNSRPDSMAITSTIFNEINEACISAFSDTTKTILDMNNCLLQDCDYGVYAAGNVEIRPGTSRFAAARGYYMQFDAANSGIINLVDADATKCLFDGVSPIGNTAQGNFDIEDKLNHYLDNGVFAYIKFLDSTIYVSNNDGNMEVTRALDKAGEDWNIHVKEVNTNEAITVTEQLHITTYETVNIGHLTLNLIGGKQLFLHDTITLRDGLTLNSGKFNTRDGLCSVGEILNTTGNKSVVANGASYVDGPLQVVLQTTGTDTIFFPVGTSNSRRPLSIYTDNTVTGNWDEIVVTSTGNNTPSLAPSNGISHVSQLHYWQASSSQGLAHDNVVYNASYSVFGTDDQADQASSLRIANVQGGQWYNIGGIGTADINGSIESTDPVTEVTDVVLANAKAGKNRLGKANVVAAFDATSVCHGNATTFTDNSTALSGNIVGYKWDFGDAAINSDTAIISDPKYTYTNPGTYTVRQVIFSDLGNTDTTYRTINVYANPVVGFIEEITCFPEACRFIDTSSVASPDLIAFRNWTIDGADYSIAQVNHTFPATGTYTAKLLVETQFGCKDSVSNSFTQGDSVKVAITPAGPITICAGDTVQLTAAAGFNEYRWNTGDVTNTSDAAQQRTYIVTAFNSNFCFGVDSVSVSLIASPTANAGNDVSIEYGESTTLTGSGGTTYSWSPPDRLNDANIANPIASPLTTTAYVLTVSNSQGCTDTDTVEVTVGQAKLIEVPNLLSPNGDGANDVWDLSKIPDIENANISVLNRWGKVVYTTTDYQHNWEGTFNGEPLPDGTYLYIIDGSEFFDTLKGPLQIIR